MPPASPLAKVPYLFGQGKAPLATGEPGQNGTADQSIRPGASDGLDNPLARLNTMLDHITHYANTKPLDKPE